LSQSGSSFPKNLDSQPDQPEVNLQEGHRARLLSRFEKGGIDAFHSHEILELLLTYTIPRRDTKPLAHKLIAHFKSINAVINASPDELLKVDGIGKRSALFFPLIREVLALCLKERYDKKETISHRRDVEEYLRFHFGHRRDEFVAALFLDNGNHAIETEIIAEGTVNQCALYPRIIIEKALRYGATSIILAHNHPGGSLTPSEADWLITERIHSAGKLLEIPLLDHIIISSEKVVSLREMPRWPQR
jgi:DNA repair protein RadC